MPKVCAGCRKKVSDRVESCPFCRHQSFERLDEKPAVKMLPATGPLRERVIIGPVFTSAGFESWFLVCMADAIIAAKQGLLFALTSALTMAFNPKNGSNPILSYSIAQQRKLASELRTMPLAELRGGPANMVWSLPLITQIVLKRPMTSNPEIIISARDGRKQIYGFTQVFAFAEAAQHIASLFPALVRTENMNLPGVAPATNT